MATGNTPTARYRNPRSIGRDFIKRRPWLDEPAGGEFHHQVAIGIYGEIALAGEAQGDPAGIGAGMQGQVILGIAASAIKDEVDAGIKIRTDQAAEVRHAVQPALGAVAEDIRSVAGLGIESLPLRGGMAPANSIWKHVSAEASEEFVRRFAATDEKQSAARAGDELELGISLPAIRLEVDGFKSRCAKSKERREQEEE